ncbi:endothelin-converting enzyme, partial [Apiospora aurea]
SSESLYCITATKKTWRRRRWVSFVASIILLVAFVVILILSGVLSRFKGKEKMAASLCMTPECLEAANGIIGKSLRPLAGLSSITELC